MSLTKKIKNLAIESGFDLVGISKLKDSKNSDYLKQWLESNHHGDMKWMEKNMDRRLYPKNHLFGKAMSAITVGLYYRPLPISNELKNNPSRGLIARYARYDDYHHIMEEMLKELANKINQEINTKWNWRVYVDTGPILEREVGERADLGFTGKNTTLINLEIGSYFFIGEIVCDLDLEEMDSPRCIGDNDELDSLVTQRNLGTCGLCARCLDKCPTNALIAPYKMDARRCVSYLTIENKGSIPLEFRSLVKNWIYGCDICQEVCPWNKKVSGDIISQLKIRPEMVAPKLLDLLNIKEDGFEKYFADSPILRIKRERFVRNVLVAVGNWGSSEAKSAVEKLIQSDSELVSEHAKWALGKLKALN